ncbi:MAG TPA: SRPBCC domain-containing protein [Candidatus Eisenbacteria bacterium]|nr:SRPBCC domain-containing protein [Candidatus Eisenbacteria bacterium]
MIRRFCIAILALVALGTTGAVPARADGEEALFREAVVEGPTDLVWRLLTTKKGMQAWLAPQADVDWRVGGLIRTHHDAAGRIGDAQTTVSRVLSLDAGRRFSVKLEHAPEGYPFAQFVEGTWYDVALDALPGGRTRIRFVGHGLGEGWARYATAPMFQQGADLAFGQLKKALASQVEASAKPAPSPAKKSEPRKPAPKRAG